MQYTWDVELVKISVNPREYALSQEEIWNEQ